MAELGQKLVFGGVSARNNLFLRRWRGTRISLSASCATLSGAGLCFTGNGQRPRGFCTTARRRGCCCTPSTWKRIPPCSCSVRTRHPARRLRKRGSCGLCRGRSQHGLSVPKVLKTGRGAPSLQTFPWRSASFPPVKRAGRRSASSFASGWNGARPLPQSLPKLCEGAGADLITVHGRTRDMYYAGEPDFAQIAAAKNAVRIPVVANGGHLYARGRAVHAGKDGRGRRDGGAGGDVRSAHFYGTSRRGKAVGQGRRHPRADRGDAPRVRGGGSRLCRCASSPPFICAARAAVRSTKPGCLPALPLPNWKLFCVKFLKIKATQGLFPCKFRRLIDRRRV